MIPSAVTPFCPPMKINACAPVTATARENAGFFALPSGLSYPMSSRPHRTSLRSI